MCQNDWDLQGDTLGNYRTTHSWLTFRLDLTRVTHRVWLLLGEIRSKCEHVAGVPLQPDVAERLHRMYLAKGVLATTAIEGNTLSEEEVEKYLLGRLELPKSKQYLQQEIANIVEACNRIWEEAEQAQRHALTPAKIKSYNAMVLKDLALGEDVVSGEWRQHSVGVARYRAPDARDVPELIDRLCGWLDTEMETEDPELEIPLAALRAVLAHLYLAWIHPFGDGNGRTARLIEVQLLITAGVPTPAAHLLSNHYNETRAEYYRQLDYASKSGGDITQFLLYALEGFRDGLAGQAAKIREQILDVTWQNYVHEQFKDKTSPTDARRRRFVLDLARKNAVVPHSELRTISMRVATAYARRTTKTLSRDLNALMKMGLVQRKDGGYATRRDEIVLAFLPARCAAKAATPKIPPAPAPTPGANSTNGR